MAQNMNALTSRAIQGMFFNALISVMGASWAMAVSHYNGNSDQNSEQYAQLGATPQFNEWIGGRNVKTLDPKTLTIANVKYEATLADYADNFKYDKTGQMRNKVNGFARRSVTHWAKLLTAALRLGTSTAGADGQTFFSANHHGSQNNLLTASDNSLLNVAAPTNPTAVEMANVIGACIAIMQGWVDDADEPLNEEAAKFLIVVPPNMGFVAQQAATKASFTGGADNPIFDANFEVEIAVNARLNASGEDDDFYIFRTDGDTRAAVLQEQEGIKLSSKAEGSDFEHDTDMWEFGAKAVRGVGLYNWENAAKVTLS